MKTKGYLALAAVVLFALFLLGHVAYAKHYPPSARTIEPVVDTDWLETNMGSDDLVIIDVRSPDAYLNGHIPGSINEPFATGFTPETGPTSHWIVGRNGLWLQLPALNDLFITIGNLGISDDSRVVIVSDPNPTDPAPHYGLSAATRVAATLIYAGVRNVAILDGGYGKWLADGKPTTTDAPTVTPVNYSGDVNEDIFIDREYLKKRIKTADIIDARDADVYYGVTIEPYAGKAGHIPNASSLPAPWIWNLVIPSPENPDTRYYVYKDPELLGNMADGVIDKDKKHGKHKAKEIIVYCGVGGYASSCWFVLTQMLGYEHVRFYDGSAQEWVLYDDMVPYQWE